MYSNPNSKKVKNHGGFGDNYNYNNQNNFDQNKKSKNRVDYFELLLKNDTKSEVDKIPNEVYNKFDENAEYGNYDYKNYYNSNAVYYNTPQESSYNQNYDNNSSYYQYNNNKYYNNNYHNNSNQYYDNYQGNQSKSAYKKQKKKSKNNKKNNSAPSVNITKYLEKYPKLPEKSRELIFGIFEEDIECIICHEYIESTGEIWNCKRCYNFVHMTCIYQWIEKYNKSKL